MPLAWKDLDYPESCHPEQKEIFGVNYDMRPLVVSGSLREVADGGGVVPGHCLRLVSALACAARRLRHHDRK
jgi:hypothetical protein